MGQVQIPTPRGELPGYLATPPGPGPWPGVIVVFDAGGMTGDARNQADWLARDGYLTLVPDLYRGRTWARCLVPVMRDAARRRGPVFGDLDVARNWLAASEGCTGRTGVIGFCMGGGFAMLLASGHGYSASSVNYGGRPPRDGVALLSRACPVVASYGGRDRSQRGAADRLERILTVHGIPHDVKEYPEAGHGFLNDHEGAGDRVPLVLSLAGRFVATGYHDPSARDARRRIISFFNEHLRASSKPFAP